MQLNQIDLNKLNTFLAVVENNGISKAAIQLLLSRSAISQAISSLEDSLNVQLFHRVGKKLILTESGTVLFKSIRSYQSHLQKTIENLGVAETNPTGFVRLGLFIGFSKTRLTDLLSHFLLQYPQVRAKLVFLSQSELHSALLEHRIDFALSIYPLNHETKSISSSRLFEEKLILVGAKKYFCERPSLDEVQALPIIEYFQNDQLFRSWIQHHYGKEPTSFRVRAYAATVDFVLELILKNIGVGIVPQSIVNPYLRDRRLFHIKTGKPELVDFVWLNELKGFQHDCASKLFLEHLKEFL
jgi:DNA-binding transcriptional LysR family regulator